jgi:hypothetical protein
MNAGENDLSKCIYWNHLERSGIFRRSSDLFQSPAPAGRSFSGGGTAMVDSTTRGGLASGGWLSAPVAGVVAGLVAGAAYLLAQVAFAATLHGGGAEPLQRIAAILLGPDLAPPPAEWNTTVTGMGLLIHFALAMVFGRLVGAVAGDRGLAGASAAGAAVGAALYALNFLLIAPDAFPWFEQSPPLTTLVDHLLFGAIAGSVYALLRRDRAGGSRA